MHESLKIVLCRNLWRFGRRKHFHDGYYPLLWIAQVFTNTRCVKPLSQISLFLLNLSNLLRVNMDLDGLQFFAHV